MENSNKIIYEKEIEGKQLRIEISSFRDKEYLHFRWWYESYDEGFLPSSEGVSVPLDLESVKLIVTELINILTIKDLEEILGKRKDQRIS